MTTKGTFERHNDVITAAIHRRPVAFIVGSIIVALVAVGLAYLAGGEQLAAGFGLVATLHITASLIVIFTRNL